MLNKKVYTQTRVTEAKSKDNLTKFFPNFIATPNIFDAL
jgi:hypothetical protein